VLTTRSTYFLGKLGKRIVYGLVFLIALWSLSHVFIAVFGWLPQRYMIPVALSAGVVWAAFIVIGGPAGLDGNMDGVRSRWWRLSYGGVPLLGLGYFTPWNIRVSDGSTAKTWEPFWQATQIEIVWDCSGWDCREVPVIGVSADWGTIVSVVLGALVMALALVAHWERPEIRDLRLKHHTDLKDAEMELRFRLAARDYCRQPDKAGCDPE